MKRLPILILCIAPLCSAASMEQLYGTWQFMVEGGLIYELKYKFALDKNKKHLHQFGYIKLSGEGASPDAANFNYTLSGTIHFIDSDTMMIKPVSVQAKKIQDVLGVITPEFIADFVNNTEQYETTVEFTDNHHLKAKFDTDESAVCVWVK
ncbi:hypothetical protein HG263_02190 [Pseudoalteromonas sp. JBTF-M23]|uniref:DUF306 domain-containing protein n=1 Tax=Pseudoalteromonas caenipelagi TaxID=2726988 RepID=A0A849V8V9_9GAMM|nr:hypothetical protein [Pseudoalteromonas caenipelagi]NOU49358.1 hypothetical protein [Pseudoalteromonas caenipelagi]